MDREGSEKRSQRLASLLVPCAVEPSCGQQKRPLVKAVHARSISIATLCAKNANMAKC